MSKEGERKIIQSSADGDLSDQSVTRDSRGRVRWRLPGNTDEENLALGIQNIQGLFLKRFPEFIERYPRGEDGTIIEVKREEARDYILEQVTPTRNFSYTFGSSPGNIVRTPYFGGSYRQVLELSFVPWGIDFEFDKKIRKPEDDEWQMTVQEFATKYGLGSDTINSLIEDSQINNVVRFNSNGLECNYYREKDLLSICNDIRVLPQIDRVTEGYVDEEGNIWRTRMYFSRQGYSKYIAERLGRNIRSIKGRTNVGNRVTLYHEGDLLQALNHISSLPQVDQQTGEYIDRHKEVFITLSTFCKEQKVHGDTLRRRISFLSHIEGKDKTGRVTKLYNKSDLTKVLQNFREDNSKKSIKDTPNISLSPDEANNELLQFLEVEGE
jgi:hypothetical protein